MEINSINHFETLIGSLNKLFLDAKNKGIIRNKELSLLNLIYKLLNSECLLDINFKKRRALIDLYYKILNKYSFLCKSNIILSDKVIIKTNIKKTHISDIQNTAPVIIDPEPVDPPDNPNDPPFILDNGFNVSIIGSRRFEIIDFTKGYTDYNGGVAQTVKINSLPSYGILVYNGINVLVNDLIPVNNINNLVYVSLPQFKEMFDPFTFSMSGSTEPTLFSNIATMTGTRT